MLDRQRAIAVLCVTVPMGCGLRFVDTEPEELHEAKGCTSNAECDSNKLCVRNRCVQCTTDEQCSCRERCVENACQPLAPVNVNQVSHAHGTWRRQIGKEDLFFDGMCSTEQDCEIGEICNTLTAGCVRAADYQRPCSDTRPCDAGSSGELLECDKTHNRCLPAPRCEAEVHCCGFEGLRCDEGTSLCLTQRTDCTPPQTIAKSCPFEPKERDTCAPGMFCSGTGRCVQCSCDDDCPTNSGLTRCYLSTGLCVGERYCEGPEECRGDNETCDTVRRACAARCDSREACPAEFYCDDRDHVCRALVDRPCGPDVYEPNNTIDAATGAGQPLTLPQLGSSVTVSELSLCDGDEDWYTLELSRGQRVVISGTGVGVSADVEALAPDGITKLASGPINAWASYSVDFTANVDGVHYLSVVPWNNSTGYYDLTMKLLQGDLCIDPIEEVGDTVVPNNTPAQATMFYDFTHPQLLDTEACVSQNSNDTHVVACGGALLKLCAGDVDYYTIVVAAGAFVSVGLSNFGGDLALGLYGPYGPQEPVDTSRRASHSDSYWGDEVVSAPARPGGTFLIHVSRLSGDPTSYDLAVEVTMPEVICQEDVFDAPTAAPGSDPALRVQDPAGYNDTASNATWVALTSGETTVVASTAGADLTLCGPDQDWFRLGEVDETGAFFDLPAGLRVSAELRTNASVDSSPLTLAAGAGDGAMTAGSADVSQPQRKAVLVPTTGGAHYVQVATSNDNTETISYRLTIHAEAPPPCDLDGLGDLAETRNDAPVTATRLDGPPWPTAVGDRHVFSVASPSRIGLSLCGLDNDWYRINVPDGASALASVQYDASLGNLGLALYSDAVASIDEPTAGNLPDVGLLDMAQETDTGYVRVFGGSGGADAYVVAYNRAGWPLHNYSLSMELVESGCRADAYEPNDEWRNATDVQLVPVLGDSSLAIGIVDPLTVCDAASDAGSADWFAMLLGKGDSLRVRAYYSPSQGDLDIEMRGRSPADNEWAKLDSDSDDVQKTGILEVQHTLSQDDGPGSYMVAVKPYFDNANHYYLEALVRRGCVDDVLEPTPPATVTELSWPPPQMPQAMVLCDDEDWIALTVPAPVDPAMLRHVTVCASFNHGVGDIDLEVFSDRGGRPDHRVGYSYTKSNLERIVFSVSEEHTYYIRIFLDPRDRANTSYELSIRDGKQPCL